MRVEEFFMSDAEMADLVAWMLSEGFSLVVDNTFSYEMIQFVGNTDDLAVLREDEDYNGECYVTHRSYLHVPFVLWRGTGKIAGLYGLCTQCGPYIVLGIGTTYHCERAERNTCALFYNDFYLDWEHENCIPLNQAFFDAFERILGRITPLCYKYVDPVTKRPFWISRGTVEAVNRGEYSLMLLSEPYSLKWPEDRG